MFFTIVMIFVLFFLSIFAYSLLRKKQVIDAPPNLLATISFILLLYFSLCLVIAVPSVMLCIVALGINYLFGDYITYDSFYLSLSASYLLELISSTQVLNNENSRWMNKQKAPRDDSRSFCLPNL